MAAEPLKVAALVTEYRPGSHADVLLTKYLKIIAHTCGVDDLVLVRAAEADRAAKIAQAPLHTSQRLAEWLGAAPHKLPSAKRLKKAGGADVPKSHLADLQARLKVPCPAPEP